LFLAARSVSVKVEAAQTVFAITVTVAPVVDPLIVPLPVIDQKCVTVPPLGVTVEV
jgi:hypothetical protein